MTQIFGSGQGGYGNMGRGIAADERFPDPFCDVASLSMPESIQTAIRWCEYIMNANGVYRQAIDRVVSYFITDIEVGDLGENTIGREEKEKLKVFLEDTIGIKNVLHTVGLDFLTYGNSFTSLLIPFRRYLSCKKCGLEMPLRKIHNLKQCNFKWDDFQFHATCPQCKHTGVWRHIDRRAGSEEGISVKRWPPLEIEILWDPYSNKCTYVWKIPEDYRNQIKQGYLHYLENASWEVIEAVKEGKNLMFDDGVIFHLKEDALAGMRNRGWGISRILTNFRQAWYAQILHRYNEAIALDYIVPFRVITPAPKGGDAASGDPVHTINLSSFQSRVSAMLRARRSDPARWNVLPFPVNYQALGGDASQLAPRDLIDQALETLLKCIGMPIELFNGTLTLQAAPAALRLFEANWNHLPHNLNRFLKNLADTIAKTMSWEPASVKLTRVTHADDLNRQMAKLQLMQGAQISKTTGLASVGLGEDLLRRAAAYAARDAAGSANAGHVSACQYDGRRRRSGCECYRYATARRCSSARRCTSAGWCNACTGQCRRPIPHAAAELAERAEDSRRFPDAGTTYRQRSIVQARSHQGFGTYQTQARRRDDAFFGDKHYGRHSPTSPHAGRGDADAAAIWPRRRRRSASVSHACWHLHTLCPL
ncbi:hypothetical protein EBZ39_04465 [bacterium]|nr:hypothetical protein [bacterium]